MVVTLLATLERWSVRYTFAAADDVRWSNDCSHLPVRRPVWASRADTCSLKLAKSRRYLSVSMLLSYDLGLGTRRDLWWQLVVSHCASLAKGVEVIMLASLIAQHSLYDQPMRVCTLATSVFIALCTALPVPILAQHMNAADAPCHGGTTLDGTNCFYTAAKKADAELNQVYGRVQAKLVPDERDQLQATQRLWLRYHEANCKAERGIYQGGSASSMVNAACLEIPGSAPRN
jgi:uncharacterized protein YecT (DUF1311 family)